MTSPLLSQLAFVALQVAGAKLPPDDYLTGLPAPEIAAWYRRLGNSIRSQDAQSLAAQCLLHYLDGPWKTAPVPSQGRPGTKADLVVSNTRIKGLSWVKDNLEGHRKVFCSERAVDGSRFGKTGGAKPRIKAGQTAFSMTYDGQSVEIPLRVHTGMLLGTTSKEEGDVFMALHNFGLHSEVDCEATNLGSGKYEVRFTSWQVHAVDSYDWNYSEHLTVPNPDFGTGGIATTKETIRVFHTDKQKMEVAGLAGPYDIVSEPWAVTDTDLLAPFMIII